MDESDGQAGIHPTGEVAPQAAFDYIIVGAGSAGAACAARLAQQSEARILLLEGGGEDDLPELHEPTLWLSGLATRATKFFATAPQHHAGSHVHHWPRGHALGGSSSINAMIYVRGHRSDYDSWAAAGNAGWAYADVLPIFKAIEDFAGGACAYRGVGGPLHVSIPAPGSRHEGAQAFMQACGDLGYRENPDFNAERLDGQTWVNLSVRDSRRQSTAVCFLRPAMARANLTVLTDAPVQELAFEAGRCTGLTYLHGGRPVTVRAEREVILCAGAIDTPRLLLLSGIGPADELQALGIRPRLDLPVGRGLQDHVLGAGCNYEAKAPVPASRFNSSEVYMWDHSEPGLAAPDIVALYVSIPFASPALPMSHENGYAILSGVSRPHSRGTLRLASADPAVPPLVDPNYLADARDRKALRVATELCRAIGAGAAYHPYRKREVLPGGDPTDEFLDRSVHTFFHPTSTCRMGIDRDCVVDPQLRVHGVPGLRVADASIMPSITTTNTNATSIMIGWKCAEMLLQDAA